MKTIETLRAETADMCRTIETASDVKGGDVYGVAPASRSGVWNLYRAPVNCRAYFVGEVWGTQAKAERDAAKRTARARGR